MGDLWRSLSDGPPEVQVEESELQKLWLRGGWVESEEDFFLCEPKVNSYRMDHMARKTFVEIRGYVWENKQDPIKFEWPAGWVMALRAEVGERMNRWLLWWIYRKNLWVPDWVRTVYHWVRDGVKYERRVVDIAVVYPALRIACPQERHRVVHARFGPGDRDERFWPLQDPVHEKHAIELMEKYNRGWDDGVRSEQRRRERESEGSMQAVQAIIELLKMERPEESDKMEGEGEG